MLKEAGQSNSDLIDIARKTNGKNRITVNIKPNPNQQKNINGNITNGVVKLNNKNKISTWANPNPNFNKNKISNSGES